jgi:CRISPR-associated protein (TIGR02584 family)
MTADSALQDDDLKEDYTLLAVLGERPQVMTELIWSLAQDDAYPERVIVLTTARGEQVLRAQLLGEDPYRRFANYDDRWSPFCEQVLKSDPFDPDEDVEVPQYADGTKIEDIYEPRDGRLFENWCFDLVHSLTRELDGPPLYGCIAGGRKTMTQDVTTAFTLYARGGDRLFHVIVPEHVEEDETFFWPRRGYEDHAEYADDVHRVDKPFPHLRLRLEDGLLSEVSGVDERSHYQELLDILDPEALARPKNVTLRLQRGSTDVGTHVASSSDSELIVEGASGSELGSISLPPTLVATWLVLMERLWRPGKRAVTCKSQLVTEEVDEQRRAVLGAFGYDTSSHGDVKPWVEPEYWGDKKDYPPYYSDHISKLNIDPFKENSEAEPLFERYFKVVRPPKEIQPDDWGEWPYYALPTSLPEGVDLEIEAPTSMSLAEEKNWPFEHLSPPEVVDG